jgi:hypothetical protein
LVLCYSFCYGENGKLLVRGLSLFSLGTFLVVAPWMLRYYLVAGHLFTVLPDKLRAVAQRFQMHDGLTPRMNDISIMGEGIDRLVEFSFEHPVEIAEYLNAHFLHNGISTILTLPIRFTSCCSISSYMEDNPFWGSWDSGGLFGAVIPVRAIILLITLGIGIAWKTYGIVGLYPLSIHMLHNLNSIMWRISDWRFILPVDCTGFLYYCVCLVNLF